MRSNRAYAVFCLVCSVFGTTFLAIRIGIDAGASPFLFAGIRFVAAGAILGAVLLATGRTTLRALVALAPRAALLSSLYIVGNFGANFWAEQYIGSSTAAQIAAVGPIATAALSGLFLGKRLRAGHYVGLAAGFAGVWLIVRGSAPASGGGNESLVASIVMLSGAVAFSGAAVLYKRLFDETADPFAVNSLNMLSGGFGLLVLSAVFERRPFPAAPGAWGALAYLVVVGSLVGHSANLWLVKKAGPLFASGWCYVSPAIATAVGAVVLGERVTLGTVAGTAATLAGVALIALAERPGFPEARPASPASAAARHD